MIFKHTTKCQNFGIADIVSEVNSQSVDIWNHFVRLFSNYNNNKNTVGDFSYKLSSKVQKLNIIRHQIHLF